MDTKRQLADEVARASGIDVAVLMGKSDFFAASIAQRMSWAARRVTARVEDLAYCLLGIFRINMSMNYGEGSSAFLRLQIALIERYPNDQTIFAWTGVDGERSGLLASSPANFVSSGDYQPISSSDYDWSLRPRPIATTRDVSITIAMRPWGDGLYLGFLQCKSASDYGYISIYLRKASSGNEYVRIRLMNEDLRIEGYYSSRNTIRDKTVIVPNFEEPSSTAAPMRRLDRIAALDGHHIPGESSPSTTFKQDDGHGQHGLTPTNDSYAVGFHLRFICGLESSEHHVNPAKDIEWDSEYHVNPAKDVKWDPETKTLTAELGRLPDDGMFGTITFRHRRTRVQTIRLGVDAEERPVCFLATPEASWGHWERENYRDKLKLWVGALSLTIVLLPVALLLNARRKHIHRGPGIWNHHANGSYTWDPTSMGSWTKIGDVASHVDRRGLWLLRGHYSYGFNVLTADNGRNHEMSIDISKKSVDGRWLWDVNAYVFLN